MTPLTVGVLGAIAGKVLGVAIGYYWRARKEKGQAAQQEEAYQNLNRLHDLACSGWRQADAALQRLQTQYNALAERHGERTT